MKKKKKRKKTTSGRKRSFSKEELQYLKETAEKSVIAVFASHKTSKLQ